MTVRSIREERRRRVLVAADEPDVHVMVLAVLRGSEFDIVGHAQDGHDAIGIASATALDVALLDYQMPELNGVAAARGVRALQPGCRVVLMSVLDADAKTRASADVDFFMEKFDIVRLPEILRQVTTD